MFFWVPKEEEEEEEVFQDISMKSGLLVDRVLKIGIFLSWLASRTNFFGACVVRVVTPTSWTSFLLSCSAGRPSSSRTCSSASGSSVPPQRTFLLKKFGIIEIQAEALHSSVPLSLLLSYKNDTHLRKQKNLKKIPNIFKNKRIGVWTWYFFWMVFINVFSSYSLPTSATFQPRLSYSCRLWVLRSVVSFSLSIIVETDHIISLECI